MNKSFNLLPLISFVLSIKNISSKKENSFKANKNILDIFRLPEILGGGGDEILEAREHEWRRRRHECCTCYEELKFY